MGRRDSLRFAYIIFKSLFTISVKRNLRMCTLSTKFLFEATVNRPLGPQIQSLLMPSGYKTIGKHYKVFFGLSGWYDSSRISFWSRP
jgi:hypothetical protein